MKAIRRRKSILRLRTNRRHRSGTNVQSRWKSKLFSKKIIVNAIRQFSCRELPKPIKFTPKINRAFNQKKRNPTCAECKRDFTAFCRKETAT
jgi:Holliday junction resolvase RusA-like endonuclease